VETSASFEARSAPLPHPANRKQDQVQPDCGDAAKANSHAHRETKVTAPVLDSTPHFTHPPNDARRAASTVPRARAAAGCPQKTMRSRATPQPLKFAAAAKGCAVVVNVIHQNLPALTKVVVEAARREKERGS
jgi:hypothetical protein